MKLNLKINRRSVLLMHIVAWAIIFSLPYIFGSEYAADKDRDELAFQHLDTATNFFWMGLFYFNILVLMPYLFNRKRYGFYIVTLLLSFFVIMLLHGVLFTPFVPGHQFNFFTSSAHNIVPFLFTVLISSVYSLVAQKVKSDMVAAKTQQENLTSELSFLRSQINPHFLFNVLNNIVALVRMKSKDLEPTVMKLSSLLQYMLYETDDEKVVLKSEVEYLHAYIDLQKQRYGDELDLQVLFVIQEEWHTIEPMLLIPFVENAFKHGGIIQHL
jgi:two-component system LytT family sensor kinase